MTKKTLITHTILIFGRTTRHNTNISKTSKENIKRVEKQVNHNNSNTETGNSAGIKSSVILNQAIAIKTGG